MKKRHTIIPIVLLILIISTTLASCGKPNHYEGYMGAYNTIKKLTRYSFETSVIMTLKKDDFSFLAADSPFLTDDIDIHWNVTGEIDKQQKKMRCIAQYKNYNDIQHSTQYQPAFSFVADHQFVYLEVKSFIPFMYKLLAPSMDSNFNPRELENFITVLADGSPYLAFPIRGFSNDIWQAGTEKQVLYPLKNRIEGIVNPLLSSRQSAFSLNTQNNEYAMELSYKDISVIVNAILDDIDKDTNWYANTFVNNFSEQCDSKVAQQLQNNKQQLINDIEKQIQKIRSLLEHLQPVLKSSLAYQKSNNQYSCNLTLSHNHSSFIQTTHKIVEKNSIVIQTPTHYYELAPQLSLKDNFAGLWENTEDNSNQNETEITPGGDAEFGFITGDSMTDNGSQEGGSAIPDIELELGLDLDNLYLPPESSPQPPTWYPVTGDKMYSFIDTKKINLAGNKFTAVYILQDQYPCLSNDGFYSAYNGVSVATRIVPYDNQDVTANDLVVNTINYDKGRMENSSTDTYKILSTDNQFAQDVACGIIQYTINQNDAPCFNVYKREISQDKRFVIETNVIFNATKTTNDNMRTTFKEILNYMGVNFI